LLASFTARPVSPSSGFAHRPVEAENKKYFLVIRGDAKQLTVYTGELAIRSPKLGSPQLAVAEIIEKTDSDIAIDRIHGPDQALNPLVYHCYKIVSIG
jgi:hypothetical protein